MSDYKVEVLDELAEQANQILYFEASAPLDLAYKALKDRLLSIYEAGYYAGKGVSNE